MRYEKESSKEVIDGEGAPHPLCGLMMVTFLLHPLSTRHTQHNNNSNQSPLLSL